MVNLRCKPRNAGGAMTRMAMLLPFLALKEPLGAMRVAGTVVVVIGIAMIFADGFSS